ncbi:MAG: hypothetical protein ACTHKJ_02565, partial [Candidatus Nitrosocosmicus sp.]
MTRTIIIILLLIFSIPLSISMVSITPSVYLITQYPQALAQNYNTSASVSPPGTSTMDKQSNSSITLGNPIFTEYDKTTTPPKPSVVNGTDGLQASYLGSGVVKGVNFTANGSVFIVPRSDGFADLRGHAVMSTANGEKGTYNFYSLGHQDANGSAKDNGALFFQTTSNGSAKDNGALFF